MAENKKKKNTKNKTNLPKKSLVILGAMIFLVSAVYISMAAFFTNHFFINTQINGHNVSGKKAADVNELFQSRVEDYTLTVYEKENQREILSGSDFSLTYKESKAVQNILEKQKAFLWPQSLFSKNPVHVTIDISYDQKALEEKIASMQAVTAGQTPPQSAYPKFDGNQFVIEPEIPGNALNLDILEEKIRTAVTELDETLSLTDENCYAKPKYTASSEKVQTACAKMNEYCKASVTYTMNEPVVVDKALISTWVTVDDEMNVILNETSVRQWLREFGKTYDTVGKTRTLTTPAGKTAEVSGGTYGWSVDEDAEYELLLNHIKSGETLTKEPLYEQTAAARAPQDWGNTYVDVDLTAQHMWYIVDGTVVFECDVVTGEPIPSKETPAGVYDILEKLPGKTLIGETNPATGQPIYRTYVNYWMRVTYTGIGFHDALWKTEFGGDLYKHDGSHGCINMSYNDAQTFYDMIANGVPVVIHY